MKIEGFEKLLLQIGEMNGTLKALDKKMDVAIEIANDHEERISDVEGTKQYGRGALAMLFFISAGMGGIVGVAASVVTIGQALASGGP